MIINDKVFGELEYDNIRYWIKKEKEIYTFFNKDFEINLHVKRDIEETKRKAYLQYKKKQKEIISQMEETIYNYYQEICEELREQYTTLKDEWAPIISKKEELANLITRINVIISENRKNIKDRQIDFIFDVTWDIEEGLGIRLINEKIAIFGAQCDVL